ncbi:uncharacterized protein LOC119079377 [Bradysia coprophila]|uniref:uncharacterized protein LOC119079377 n=1 Tax=Bradysia coprophila TaxID=38358 RepID=UPI00187D8ED0|nr:uncharacterized protein LOC119079377 [Bradysia coprophila]XP_037043151.1 uncharacterized protein LOC119079377 [Bradysia coprophila]XP_037043152.1 uncharacterized protein LOC119079377 [Bradysia coprophila]
MKYIFIGVVVAFSLLLLLARADVDVKDLIPVQIVPGTKLYTGIYYTLSMWAFPQGWITWVDKSPNVYNIEIELNPENLPLYAVGKSYEVDNQWTIGPSEEPNQFTLRSRRKNIGLLTYLSDQVGSGYYAAILDSPKDRVKMAPGGEWHNDALWKLHESGKYHKIENVGMKGYFLTWTYTMYNKYNYFIQLANYDAKDDAKFLFTPSAIKLVARVYDFEFEEEPDDVFNDNGKRSVAYKLRFANDSPTQITKTIEETIETKDSVTFSFTESFSMMYQTSIEASVSVFKASASMKFEGGISATQSKTKDTTRKMSVKDEIKIPKYTDIEVSIYTVHAENVVIPFKAKMLVTGTAQRIVADNPSETQDGEVPGDVIESYIRAKGGKKMNVIKRTGNSFEISITGEMTGNVALKSTVSTREVKKIKPPTV